MAGFWKFVCEKLGLPEQHPEFNFSETEPKPIDRMFYELRQGSGRVSRDEALSVPAVLKGRNLLCGPISTLPLVQKDSNNSVVRNPLFEQVDPDVANIVTLAQTVEDLLFEATSFWRVTARDFAGYPISAIHLEHGSVSVEPPLGRAPSPLPSGEDLRRGTVRVNGEVVPWADLIRFDSPNPAVLKTCGRAIRRAARFDKAAEMYAEDPRPLDYFTPAEGEMDPEDDTEIDDLLDDWSSARRSNTTAYVPGAYKYNTVELASPRDLQLVELQKQAGLDLSNALGVDPEELGISTTSRTYANDVDRRKDKINDILAPYMLAITQRLSMGDVTRRGNRVEFDLNDYMKSNPTERWGVYEKAKDLGAITVDEIRRKEGEPPMPEDEQEAAPVLEIVPNGVAAAGKTAHNFKNQTSHNFSFAMDPAEFAFAVDTDTRTISGLALPFKKVTTKYGMKFRFHPGGARYAETSRVKHFKDHITPVGKALDLKESSAGMFAKLSVGRGPTGDELLQLADDGIYDGLSVGVDFSLNPEAGDVKLAADGVYDVFGYDLREITTTAMPAVDDARVTRVAASRDGGEMTDTTTSGQAPAVAEPGTAPAAPAVTLSAEQFAQLMQANQQPAPVEVERPTVVNPTRLTASTSVTEAASYRFDRQGILQPAQHDFGVDIIQAVKMGDVAARQRSMEFINAQFDVATGDVNELNPTINQSRYIDQREFGNPVWNTINKGTPPNGVQPFSWPKFNSASGLVGAHTEGSEPSSGTLTTTNQTVTPTAISGKAKITRETWDMGGTPGIGNLIWTQMKRGWFEGLEARAISVLDAASPTAIALTAGGGTTGQTLAAELRAKFAALHFVRGGWRFTDGFAQIDFYQGLVGALDDAGRPLYPAIGPSNADGTVSNRYQSVNVNGVPFLPSWALAASGSVVASSYLFDRDAVDGWATAPQELRMDNIEVAHVYIGIWGYAATAINDLTGVREITYDPVA